MKRSCLMAFILITAQLMAQDSLQKKKAGSISGYVKELGWVRTGEGFRGATATNLLHNRVNMKWKLPGSWSSRLELRNRVYWGADVRNIRGFKDRLRNANEAVDLSLAWLPSNTILLHSNIERCWVEFRKQKWQFRAGRQRINWGINNTWNPNDLFNSYNFLDFDFEERPGSDAVKAQYALNDLSNLELALSHTGKAYMLGGKYSTNYKNYDLQANLAIYRDVFTAGFGWAGSISDVGFKGEAQFYADTSAGLSRAVLSMEADYVVNGWYLSAAFLYNESGIHRPAADLAKLTFDISTRNPMPTRWNLLVMSSKEFSPLFTGSLSLIYAPGTNLLVVYPTLHYNTAGNFDLDLVWQSFFAETSRFKDFSHTVFLRSKWSF